MLVTHYSVLIFCSYDITPGNTKVNEEIVTLAQSFESLKTSVLKELDSMNVTVQQLHEVVAGVYPDNAIPKPMMVEIEAASSHHDFFTVITRHGMWNYINHHLLECIVEGVPRENQLRKELAQHKEKVEEFAQKTPIHDYIDSCSSQVSATTANVLPVDHYAPDPAMFASFQLKLDLSIKSQSLQVILALQSRVMKQFSFPHPTLLLGAINRGSVVINWHFPRVEMERVCSVANSSQYFFKELNMKAVNIDNQFQYGDGKLAIVRLSLFS